MTLTIYGIPNCDTVKRAAKYLRERGIEFVFHDYRKHPVPGPTLALWARALGWEALLNRNGTTFRGLPASDRDALDERRALALMARHPTLIRRPVWVRGDEVFVGFDETVRRELG